MEVVSANDGLLTNVEVLELLKDARRQRGKESNQIELQHRESIEIETIKYLNSGKTKVDSATVAKCISAMRKLELGLTEGELIQIANLKPESDVEFYLIIEDCSDRLGDEQLEMLKQVVAGNLSTDQQ